MSSSTQPSGEIIKHGGAQRARLWSHESRVQRSLGVLELKYQAACCASGAALSLQARTAQRAVVWRAGGLALRQPPGPRYSCGIVHWRALNRDY